MSPTANPSRGGDAKPGVFPRQPSCRLKEEVQDKEVLLPYVIRWPHKRVIALVAACFALLVAAHPAAADTTPCPTLPSSPVFAPLGDSANYSAVPGGSFEGDMSGWSLTGASVAS